MEKHSTNKNTNNITYYRFSDVEKYSVNFGYIEHVHKNLKTGSIYVLVTIDDKYSKNGNSEFIDKCNEIEKSLYNKYKENYVNNAVKLEKNTYKIFLSINFHDASCIVKNYIGKDSSLSDFCKFSRKSNTPFFSNMKIVFFGIMNSKNKFQLLIKSDYIEYFRISKDIIEKLHQTETISNRLKNENTFLQLHQEKLEMEIHSLKNENERYKNEISSLKKLHNPTSSIIQDFKTIPEEHKCKNHTLYGKYLKMIEKGIPINAVKQKCILDNIKTSLIEEILLIDPSSNYLTTKSFFKDTFYSSNDQNNLFQSNNLKAVSIKIENEPIKKEKSFFITIEQLSDQLLKLRKTCFNLF